MILSEKSATFRDHALDVSCLAALSTCLHTNAEGRGESNNGHHQGLYAIAKCAADEANAEFPARVWIAWLRHDGICRSISGENTGNISKKA
jgi:hypothetical protein